MAHAYEPPGSIAGASTSKVRSSWLNGITRFLKTYPYLILAIFFFVGWQIFPIYQALRLSFTDDRFLDDAPANLVGPAELS